MRYYKYLSTQAIRPILCTVQTRRPRWNTRAGFFQGIARSSFSTNATSMLGCPSLSQQERHHFCGLLEGCTCSSILFEMRHQYMARRDFQKQTGGTTVTTTTVDVIVLGTGAAAQSAAYPCREAGWSVAVVDDHPFGGTCPLRGCDPKKVLVSVSDLVDWSHRMQGKGVSAPGLSLSWPDLIRFKRTFTDPVPEETEQSFAQAGISTRHGRTHFVDRTSVQVGEDTLVGRHVVIATGACHADLGIPGEELLTTSTQFLDLEELPRRIVFVGGGYIAFEFAHIAARPRAHVQILHMGSRPLERLDPHLVSR